MLEKGKPSERVGRKTSGLSLERALDMAAGLPSKIEYCFSLKGGGCNHMVVALFYFYNSPNSTYHVYLSSKNSIHPFLNTDIRDREINQQTHLD
jgi:hypothetical protein